MKGPIDGQQKSGLSDDGEVVTLDQETGEPARWRGGERTITLLPPSVKTSAPRARGPPGPSGTWCSMSSMWPCKLTSPSDINRNGTRAALGCRKQRAAQSEALRRPSDRTPKAVVSPLCCTAAKYSNHGDPSRRAPTTRRADLSDRPAGSSQRGGNRPCFVDCSRSLSPFTQGPHTARARADSAARPAFVPAGALGGRLRA